jgi:hypothetical protein
MCYRTSGILRPLAEHTDHVSMHRHHHALAPPLGHTYTLASTSVTPIPSCDLLANEGVDDS